MAEVPFELRQTTLHVVCNVTTSETIAPVTGEPGVLPQARPSASLQPSAQQHTLPLSPTEGNAQEREMEMTPQEGGERRI